MKLFLPHEISAKLRTLGFDEPCIGIYVKDGEEVMTAGSTAMFKNTHEYYPHSAILYQQAVDWLREKHKTIIVIEPRVRERSVLWIYFIVKKDGQGTEWSLTYYDYYLALNNAILEALQHI